MTSKQLKKWRKSLDYTQIEMAAYVGYSEVHYRRMELGICPVSAKIELEWMKGRK